MLENLFGMVPDWAKSKLLIRIIYTVSSLGASKVAAFLTQPVVQEVLRKVFVDPTLTPGAKDFLNFVIVASVMAAGEWVIQHTHSNIVLPAIQSSEGKPSPAAPPVGMVVILILAACMPSLAWNPVSDIRENVVWTAGQQAEMGTAIKCAGHSGDMKNGETATSFLAGIAEYRFLKFSYGFTRANTSNADMGDTFKVGYKISSFFSWFSNPPTPQMEFMKNIDIGPSYSIPIFSSPHAGVLFVDINYVFGQTSSSPKPPVSQSISLGSPLNVWQRTRVDGI